MEYFPVGHRILVKPITQEEDVELPEYLKQRDFRIKYGMDKGDDLRSLQGMDRGVIEKVGPNAWMHQSYQGKKKQEDWEPWANIGDKVIFIRHAGDLVRTDDIEKPQYWFLLNDDDIKGIIRD